MNENLYIKQAEVHGMSQRGGDVQSNLRLSTEPIWSDLIRKGGADLVISMEPMESLRYLPYLSADGVIVTGSTPLVNIPDYPAEEDLRAELESLPHVIVRDIDAIAKEAGNPRGANMALLGMAAQAAPCVFQRLRKGRGAYAQLPGSVLLALRPRARGLQRPAPQPGESWRRAWL